METLEKRPCLGPARRVQDLLYNPPERGISLFDVNDMPGGPISYRRAKPTDKVALARARLTRDEQQVRLVRREISAEVGKYIGLRNKRGGLRGPRLPETSDRNGLVSGQEHGICSRVI